MSKTVDEKWYEAYEDRDSDLFTCVHAGVLRFQYTTVDTPLTPAEAVLKLREATAEIFRERNEKLPHEQWLAPPAGLTPFQLAQLTMKLYDVAVLSPLDKPWTPRGCCRAYVYQTDGPDRGLYSNDLYSVFYRIDPGSPFHKMNEATDWLRVCAKKMRRCVRKDLAPVNNGIFNCRTKKLMPFSPKYVFLTKSAVDYVPDAVNPVIHNPDDGTDWDVESWINGLSGDPVAVGCLWRLAGAAVRPHTNWDTVAALYPEGDGVPGGCGRSSYCKLVRGLSGWGNYMEYPPIDSPLFVPYAHHPGEERLLEPWHTFALAAIVDEGEMSCSVEDFLSMCYSQVTKYEPRWRRTHDLSNAFRHHGFHMQCVTVPPVQDSVYFDGKKILRVPLTKCFKGRERTYIKDDYVGRREVLEYVLWRALNMGPCGLAELAEDGTRGE